MTVESARFPFNKVSGPIWNKACWNQQRWRTHPGCERSKRFIRTVYMNKNGRRNCIIWTCKKHEKVNVPNIGMMRLFSFFDQNHYFYSLQLELKVLVERFLKVSSPDEINQILDPEIISKNLTTIKCESDTGKLARVSKCYFHR